jgi:hypothetical protein
MVLEEVDWDVPPIPLGFVSVTVAIWIAKPIAKDDIRLELDGLGGGFTSGNRPARSRRGTTGGSRPGD